MAGGIIGSIIRRRLTGGAGPALGAGIGAAIPSIAEIAKVIVDRTIPDPQKKAEAQAEIEQALTARETARRQPSRRKTSSRTPQPRRSAGQDRFSSRWRPALGWACVAAFVYQFLAAPMVTWLGAISASCSGSPSPLRRQSSCPTSCRC